MSETMNITDPYFMSYHIYSLALSDKDMRDGLGKALYFTKLAFNADNVILYKLNESGDYAHIHNSALMNTNSSLITVVLNSAKTLLDNKKKYELNLNFNNIGNIAFIKINVNDNVYVIALTGNKKFINLVDDKFLNIFIDTMDKILDKLEQFEELKKSSDVDTLTGLSNRNAYERDMNERQISDGMIYVIFDLFRLKTINDNYNHKKGDEYINKAAEVLKKHFPKYIYTIDSTGKKVRSETGSCIYRIGGDEFVLVSDTETCENVQVKLMIIQDEIKNMDLNVDEPLGINYGFVQAKDGDKLRDLYLKSDRLLADSKREQYKRMGIERRGSK